MVKGGYLRSALAAERGVDFKKIKQARKRKAAEKSKRQVEKKDDEWEDEEEDSDEDEEEGSDENGVSGLVDDEAEESDDDEEDSDEEEGVGLDIEAFDDSDSSESEIEIEEKIERPKKAAAPAKDAKKSKKSKQEAQKKEKGTEAVDEEDDEEEEEEDEEEDVAWSDLEDLADEEREDLIPHQKQTINNQTALLAAAARIEIPTDASVTFASHQTVSGKGANTEEAIPDISDDLTRELEFLRQSLEAAKKARSLLLAEKVPFSRPNDYFAEMVKPDELMEKVKAKLIEDATAKKAAAEARKQRDLKKFGKQVQVAKLQERAKAKKETLEKIKTLKRKRQENSGDLGETEGDLFDVAVDDEIKRHNNNRSEGGRGGRGGAASAGRPNAKRQKKNEKYGFGGKKRHAKSGDAISSGDMREFSVKRMKGGASSGGRGGRGGRGGSRGGASRPGKSRRQAMANRG
ncbi:uncharacterized protein E0L32_011161 [Thyridium curvatum]|uniref:Uncharacterized protein n=1 Tax=Thyridium curvatum TaxID=1093900 RepID=A0A507AJF0_9PEZI|nr:uncharacterized protein E0L32_011161 [Thyridium curvatum]TPX06937.1 hypothetical protein E0L32_011161 [Thyridium curvatum]